MNHCPAGSVDRLWSRRAFLEQSSLGFGTLAMAYLPQADGLLNAGPAPSAPGGMDLRPRPGHFPGRAKAIISRATGSIAFRGWVEGEQARVTDACGYRLILSTGSALAKQAIARAEQLAGRTVDRAPPVNARDPAFRESRTGHGVPRCANRVQECPRS